MRDEEFLEKALALGGEINQDQPQRICIGLPSATDCRISYSLERHSEAFVTNLVVMRM